jgi:hypothetical protein
MEACFPQSSAKAKRIFGVFTWSPQRGFRAKIKQTVKIRLNIRVLG